MEFSIQKNRPGNLAFSVPTQDAMGKAEDEVTALCRDQYRKAFPERKEPLEQLEMELKWMKETGTAFHFLILREVAELSREEGYPFMANSKCTCSLIAFCWRYRKLTLFIFSDPVDSPWENHTLKSMSLRPYSISLRRGFRKSLARWMLLNWVITR